MTKRGWIVLLLVVLLFGCSSMTGKQEFNERINILEEAINQKEWSFLKDQVEEFKTFYENKKWKIQLLGDEGEYEGLNESINRLIVAIEEKDQTEAKLELATIKSLIKDIYTL